MLHNQTLIESKLEMVRPINDRLPYLPARACAAGNRFVDYPPARPSRRVVSADNVELA